MVVFPKEDFLGLEGIAHLATGGQPPLLKAHQQAFEAFARDKASGMQGYDRHWQVGHDVKSMLARMTGLPAQDFALIGNSSEGIARVVSSIDWQQGDNAVVSPLDYASGKYSLMALQRSGIELRQVPPDGMFIDIARLIDACDDRTRIVYVSQVNAHTGQKIDLAPLSQALRHRGIALLVDTSHALGAVHFDGRLCDFMVCSTYKFLLGTHMGILAWNRASWPSFEPRQVGWHSATQGDRPDVYRQRPDGRRAEIGNSNHLSVYILNTSLNYLSQIPENTLDKHILKLTETLHSGLRAMDLDILTPADPDQRGPNVSFHDRDPRALVDAAARDGILLWGEAGRVRASMHGFVDEADVVRCLDWLGGHLKERT